MLKSEYVYDGLSRLISLTNYKGTEALSSYAYTYDSNGNILTVNETVGETQHNTTYTYDKLNRIASVSGSKGADSYYEYDARGNRKVNFEQIDFLSEENAEFSYNAEDNLTYAEVGEDSTAILYSANGYRFLKQENTTYPEFYIYDENGRLQGIAQPVNLRSSDGTVITAMYPVTQYIWGPDRVLVKIDALTGNSYYYLYNGHGDVVQVVDTAGNIINQYDYDVWGNFITKEETIDNHFTYFGQTYDETTGLYYLRARYYDPTTGRFTQQDTAEDGYNWYVYGNNNPVMFVDENGEFAAAVAVATAPTWLPYVTAGIAVIGTAATSIYYAKKSKSSQKEKSTDIPSWAKGKKPKKGESGKDYAKRVMDERYGKDNYKTGPGSEYNKLKKYGDRGGF